MKPSGLRETSLFKDSGTAARQVEGVMKSNRATSPGAD
ncbi:hypothetical protein BN129_1018 [Cronobacter sakazakii 701]|nr:hypothetical protein BN129_1018 [Cronobacter sakazakii 701]